MAKRGRPTKRTPAVESNIIDGLRKGTPLTRICAPASMPCDSTVRDWMDADPDFSRAIARAREVGFDKIAIDGLEIVDDRDSDPDAASRRIRADYRLKLLAKWDPKRYGDRLDVTSGGEKIQRDVDDVSKFSRLAALIDERRRAGELPPEAE